MNIVWHWFEAQVRIRFVEPIHYNISCVMYVLSGTVMLKIDSFEVLVCCLLECLLQFETSFYFKLDISKNWRHCPLPLSTYDFLNIPFWNIQLSKFCIVCLSSLWKNLKNIFSIYSFLIIAFDQTNWPNMLDKKNEEWISCQLIIVMNRNKN